MAERKPHLLEKTMLLVGNDMMTYSSIEDHHAKLFISRVKQFPHMVYGGENNSKLDCIAHCIDLLTKARGLEIQRKLPAGACRLELAEMAHADILKIVEKAQEQTQIMLELQNKIFANGYQPLTEDERELLEAINILSHSLLEAQHSANNATLIASLFKYSAQKSQKPNKQNQPQ